MVLTTRDVYYAAREVDADIYHFHDPELIPVGILLRLLGKRVIYDVHEDIPRQMMSKYWIPKVLRRIPWLLACCAERIVPRIFNRIVVAEPSVERNFPACKTTLIQNYPILSEVRSVACKPYRERGELFIYVGGISEVRGAKEMIYALQRFPANSRAQLVLAGKISPAPLEEELHASPGWERVIFKGWLSRPKVFMSMGEARCGIVTLHPEPNYIESQPIKLFEYMAAGLPVIASDFPCWRKILEAYQCGILVNPMDPNEIAEAMKWMLNHPIDAQKMGQNGFNAVCGSLNWALESQKLMNLYRTLR
jgi:glycosyltransferase involved in cell wall biosynthesis